MAFAHCFISEDAIVALYDFDMTDLAITLVSYS